MDVRLLDRVLADSRAPVQPKLDKGQLLRDIVYGESDWRAAAQGVEQIQREGWSGEAAGRVAGRGALGLAAVIGLPGLGTALKALRGLKTLDTIADVEKARESLYQARAAASGRAAGDLRAERAGLDAARDSVFSLDGELVLSPGLRFRPAKVDEFRAARTEISAMETGQVGPGGNRRVGEALSLDEKTEWDRLAMFLSEDKKTGFALQVGDDGSLELVSVFSAPGMGRGRDVVKTAVALGADKLNAYDEGGFLPKLYGEFGFEETGRMAWDDAYRRADWRGGTPDVVDMVWKPRVATGVSSLKVDEAGDVVRAAGAASDEVLLQYDAQYPENIGRALRGPAYTEGPPPAGIAQSDINDAIVQGSLDLQADPIVANRLFGAELARNLEDVLPVEDLIDDYAKFLAPSYEPLGLAGSRAVRVNEKTGRVVRARAGDTEGLDMFDSPLLRLGFETNDDFIASERTLAFYAQSYKNATRRSEKLKYRAAFVEEFARTLSNQSRLLTNNSRGRPIFYIERQQAVDAIAARTGFNRNVIAGATAASSQQAPPMEEAFRLFIAAPFVKIQDGEAFFDAQSFRETFKWGDIKQVRSARAGIGDFPRSDKTGEYKINTFIEAAGNALADMINNPDFLSRSATGIAHKTAPYAVLALDGTNKYAVVADTNYWYAIAGTNALSNRVLTKKGLEYFMSLPAAERMTVDMRKIEGAVQSIPKAMERGLEGSVGPAAQTRAIAAAVGPQATPSSVQADIWFPLRNLINGAQDDAFLMPGETSSSVRSMLINVLDGRLSTNVDAAKHYQRALEEILSGGGKSWEDMVSAALNNVGAASGPRMTERLRTLADSRYQQFASEVASKSDVWTVVSRNGEDVIIANPSNWRATLAYGDIYTPGGAFTKNFQEAERVSRRIFEALVPFLKGASAAVASVLALGVASHYTSDPEMQRQLAERALEMA